VKLSVVEEEGEKEEREGGGGGMKGERAVAMQWRQQVKILKNWLATTLTVTEYNQSCETIFHT